MQQAEDLREEGRALNELLVTLSGSDWERPTPFKTYTVYDVVAHLHTTDLAARLALSRPDDFRRLVQQRDPSIAITMSGVRLEGAGEGELLRSLWLTTLNELCDLLAEADSGLRVPWFGPDMSVRMFASARQMETWSHGQDIYDLLKVPRNHTDRLKNVAQIGVRTFGWAYVNRGLPVPGEAPYVSLTAPSGANWEWNAPDAGNSVIGDAVDFCHVVTQGRNVQDTGLTVQGDIARQWMQIAQCFAGAPEDPPAPGQRAWG